MRQIDPSKPLLFAAMPFGVKKEPGGRREVDFDLLYRNCIQPAAQALGIESIRADEESLGGIIHGPMFERLLLAEIVVADLTFANANVFYELGIRHAARPCSTVLIYAKDNPLPFDVAPIRAIPYELDRHGVVIDPVGLCEKLTERLRDSVAAETVDSPVFQLVPGYPGISLSHDATESFRSRAIWLSELTVRAKEAVRPGVPLGDSLEALDEIEKAAAAGGGEQLPILLTVLLAYRSIQAWGEMIRLVGQMPSGSSEARPVREHLAMALNRRNGPGDRRRAVEILERLLAEHGASAESYGLLGRCLKDRWVEKLRVGDPGAGDALSGAIDAYRRGFQADPRDPYPGVNLLTLLVRRRDPGDLEEAERTAPVVSFALARKGGIGSGDYWVIAAVLELATIEGDEALARRALSAMLDAQPDTWMRDTTARNLDVLAEAVDGEVGWLSEISAGLREGTTVGPCVERDLP